MTDYLKKSFTVPASGKREDPCTHGWLDPRGRCVLCGAAVKCPMCAGEGCNGCNWTGEADPR